jgi:hypothetical protein
MAVWQREAQVMSGDLLQSTIRALDVIFGALDSQPIAADQDDDSPLALDERTTRVLSNGDVLEFDVVHISADCWTAKDANHDGRTGVGDTRELAIADLVWMAEDEIGEPAVSAEERYADSLDMQELSRDMGIEVVQS